MLRETKAMVHEDDNRLLSYLDNSVFSMTEINDLKIGIFFGGVKVKGQG